MPAGLATAPGDLPQPEIEKRLAARRYQFRHDNTTDPIVPLSGRPVRVTATSGEDCRIGSACLYYTTDGSEPSLASNRATMRRESVTWDVRTGFLYNWTTEIPGLDARTTVRYRIGGWSAEGGPFDVEPDVWAHDGQGFWFHFPGPAGLTTFAYEVRDTEPVLPAWAREAVIYHIFLDRFHPGTPEGAFPAGLGPTEIHGGTLRGVEVSLPYLESVGVTCIWLSPFFPAESYHRYDGMDYVGVDPALGTVDDARSLVAAAHARGMRVWLDFVPSHCSWHHPAFLAAQRDRSAPTASWFTFDEWPDTYRCFLQVSRSLPSFDSRGPGVREYLFDAARFWLADVGVDGFRLDHAIGPGMDFWVAFQEATRAAKPDSVNVGEATDTPDCLRRYAGRLDGILDFPLATALRRTFATGGWTLERFDGFISAYDAYMTTGPARFSFLDNHDMDRFLFLAGGDTNRLKMAALCQFTLPPTPIVYYGTEIGLSQEFASAEHGDFDVRRDMPWQRELWDTGLLEFYSALTKLRRDQYVHGGTRRTIHLDPETGTYAYLWESTRGTAASVFNFGASTAAVELPAAVSHVALSTGRPVRATLKDDGVSVTIPPYTGAILFAELHTVSTTRGVSERLHAKPIARLTGPRSRSGRTTA